MTACEVERNGLDAILKGNATAQPASLANMDDFRAVAISGVLEIHAIGSNLPDVHLRVSAFLVPSVGV